MTLPLVAIVLLAPLLLLASAVVALSARGPLGWLAAGALVAAVVLATRAACRRCWAWWQSTQAPVLSGADRPRDRFDRPRRRG